MLNLRKNQVLAIETSLKNDFKSGIHNHATGSGKSWIALELIIEYNKKYPKNNIYWICERKSILNAQFDKKCLKSRGYERIHTIFHIFNFDFICSSVPKTWISATIITH